MVAALALEVLINNQLRDIAEKRFANSHGQKMIADHSLDH
jgi:hypothetical protein